MLEPSGRAVSPIIGAAWLLLLVSVLHDLPVFSVPVLQAQSVRAAGLVIKPDSTPVSGARIVLHRVSRAAQGPLDSTTSDARGRFRLTFRADTGALYLLSARHQGIEYFSPPVHSSPERPDTAIRIVVSDTSATAPVTLVARHLVLTRPGPDGSRSVLDLLVLRNEGQRTRVAPDSVHPSWSGPLPSGTLGLELGEGDISPDAVSRRRDS
ncbi:MAG TPA: carboxypeptidase-like regulatory domain-containing protein, partial [Gemmatimonadales bacterium]|nr:carboxypeptidase-like regulatory domain-containing protein [Gemmatimonadales bacterium]